MGTGPVQLRIIKSIITPGMVVATIGRLTVNDVHGNRIYFDQLEASLQIKVISIDISPDRDGFVTLTANLNQIRDWGALSQNVDFIMDMGSLEHISNFPNALENYHRLLKTGGTIFLSNPTNGYAGHGFFQFSPEFFYRMFDSSNGYRVLGSFIEKKRPAPLTSKIGYRSQIYHSPDPASHQRRLMFQGAGKTQLLFLARKIEHRPLNVDFVQSDYVTKFPKKNSPAWLRFSKLAFQFVLRRPFRVFLKATRSSLQHRLGQPPLSKISPQNWEHELEKLDSLYPTPRNPGPRV